MKKIPFNKPYITGQELSSIGKAHNQGQLSGDGIYTQKCARWLKQDIQSCSALITHSCTAALEMSAILANIKPGDEVIVPSYTFVSTANAFVLRGAIPVFVDIRPDTLNINEKLIEEQLTPKTKAIVPVHYAGVSCEMETITKISQQNELIVIEDAAQAIRSKYMDKPVGSLGHLSCFSFHETKNIISGEGGSLIINDESLTTRAEIIREKGTNRSSFSRGEVEKYTWVDQGSSYLPGEIISAFLWSQLKHADLIIDRRLKIWNVYHNALEDLQKSGLIRRPRVPDNCQHNAHMYYIILNSSKERDQFIKFMNRNDIMCVFHYIPLHSSPYGLKVGRFQGELKITDSISSCIVRLPFWIGIEEYQTYIIEKIYEFFKYAR